MNTFLATITLDALTSEAERLHARIQRLVAQASPEEPGAAEEAGRLMGRLDMVAA